MPLPEASGRISISQMRAEFFPSSTNTNLSFSGFKKDSIPWPVRHDVFTDPNSTIKNSNSNINISDYHNTTRGGVTVLTSQGQAVTLPDHCNRIEVLIIGGGGGGAIRCYGDTRASGPGGGGGGWYTALYRSGSYNGQSADPYIRPDKTFTIQQVGSGGGRAYTNNARADASGGSSSWFRLGPDTPGGSNFLQMIATGGGGGSSANNTRASGGRAYIKIGTVTDTSLGSDLENLGVGESKARQAGQISDLQCVIGLPTNRQGGRNAVTLNTNGPGGVGSVGTISVEGERGKSKDNEIISATVEYGRGGDAGGRGGQNDPCNRSFNGAPGIIKLRI